MNDIDSLADLKIGESSYLFKEINGQPNLWKKTYEVLLSQKKQIVTFLNEIFKVKNLQIILTGAGSSAFVGEILQQSFYIKTGIPTRAIPTTDLVTHPKEYFQKSVPTLLISFARSGDSPESIATFKLAERFHKTIYHLIITCNPDGELAKTAKSAKNALIFLMPDEANDQALAMTGSFTSMVLAGLLIADISNIEQNEEIVKAVTEFGKEIIKKYGEELSTLAGRDFKRVVFLGSGPLKGGARESHLKVLELTDGQIICQYDSFLGFRHGPRAVIDESTLLFYLFSCEPYVYKYEVDLVQSINSNEHFLFSIGIGQCLSELPNLNFNLTIDLCCRGTKIPDDYFAICSVIPAQILGAYKSLALGLAPDSPSKNGGISRIVQGVTIYPY
jgi:tagatose-6-phosphate ketose/aldose isomerase